MKKIVLIIFMLLVLTSCSKELNIDYDNSIIVDVRTNSEYNESHLKEAINIPYDTIDNNIDLDKTKIIYVYCKSGKRSSIAYLKLKELGYNVIDLGAYSSIDLEKE